MVGLGLTNRFLLIAFFICLDLWFSPKVSLCFVALFCCVFFSQKIKKSVLHVVGVIHQTIVYMFLMILVSSSPKQGLCLQMISFSTHIKSNKKRKSKFPDENFGLCLCYSSVGVTRVMSSSSLSDFKAWNEPMFDYGPGSEERVKLEAAIKQYDGQVTDIPIVIGGEEIRTSDVRYQVAVSFSGSNLLWLNDIVKIFMSQGKLSIKTRGMKGI